AKSGDESGHVAVTLQAAEALLGLRDRGTDPAKDHRATTPALDAAAEVARAAVEVLDRVRGGERALERVREAEAHHGQRLVEALTQRGGGAGVLRLQAASEALELLLRRRGLPTLVRLAHDLPHVSVPLLRQVRGDVANLVDLAALHERALAVHVADRGAQRLAPVDHEQARAIGLHAALFEIAEQGEARGPVLGRALPEPEDVLVSLRVDAERDEDDVVLREVQAV